MSCGRISEAASDYFAVEDACRLAGVSIICEHGLRRDRCWEGCEMPKPKKPSKCACGNRIGAQRKSGSTICGICWVKANGHNLQGYSPKKCAGHNGIGPCPFCNA